MEQDTRAVVRERFIASRLPYSEVERRVREMGDIKPDISISDDGYWVINGEKTEFKAEVGEANIVVPDKNTSERGNPGLIYMYNESSGLRLDGDKRLCIAPANKTDIDEGKSNNKPIVPAYMSYALQRFGDNFKVALVERNGTFEIKPGMIALIFPWEGNGSIHRPNGSVIINTTNTSIVFATDPLNSSNQFDAAGTYYRVAAMCVTISLTNSSSNQDIHSFASKKCYFKNSHSDTSGTGIAYIYYLG